MSISLILKELAAEDLSHMTPEQRGLHKLANSEDDEVVGRVARNTNTSPATLDKLANHKNNVVRGVARNTNTSPNTLNKLANHKDYDVVGGVAHNKNTPLSA